MFTETMTEKVKELRELRRMQEELAAEITSIEDEIKAVLCGRAVYQASVLSQVRLGIGRAPILYALAKLIG